MLPQECIELAETRVNGFGANLATVRSDAENTFVDALIPNWNGVYSVAVAGYRPCCSAMLRKQAASGG